MSRVRCCEAECPEHPTLLQQGVTGVRRAATALRAVAWWAVRAVIDR